MLKNISIIAFGNGLSLLINFLLFPVIAKFSGPEFFGEYGYIYSIVQTVSLVSLLNLNKLLIVSNAKNVDNVFTGGVLLSFLITIMWLFFILLFDLNFYTFLTSPLLFLIMINELFISNLYRLEKFTHISILMIIKRLTLSIILLSFVYFFQNFISMLYAALISELIYFIILLYLIKNTPSFVPKKLNLKALYNRDFILILSVQNMLNRFSGQMPIIYAKNFVGLNETGYYYFANKMIQSPMAIVTKSIRSVFFIELSKDVKSFKNNDLFKIILSYIIITLFGLLSLFYLETLFMGIADDSWSNSYKFFYYLFPMLMSNSMASIFRDKMLLSGKNIVLLYLDIILTFFRITLFIIAIKINMLLINYIAILALTLIIFNFITLFFSIKK